MRTPIASDLMSRDGTLQKDAGTKNAIIEVAGESSAVRRRPGSVSLGAAGSGVGQLLACYNGELKSIIGNTLADLIVTTIISGGNGLPSMPAGGGWAAPAYGAGKFVTINKTTNQPATSTDGYTWTLHPAIDMSSYPGEIIGGVAFGNGVFLALIEAVNEFLSSSNGISWSYSSGVLGAGGSYAAGFGFSGGKFCAVNYDGDYFATSSDGVSWSYCDPNIDSSTYLTSEIVASSNAVYFDGRFYVALMPFGDQIDIVSYNASLASPIAGLSGINSLPGGDYEFLCANSTRIFIAGRAYSTNGTTWTAATGVPSGDAIRWAYIDDSVGYVLTWTNVLYKSTNNGATWAVEKIYAGSPALEGIAKGGGKYIAIGNSQYSILNELSYGGSGGVEVPVVNVDSSQAITSIEPSLQFFAEVVGQAQSQNVLFLRNSREAWKYDGTTLSKITDADYPGWSVVTPTSITRSGSTATVTLPSSVNWQSGSSVTIAGAAQAEYNGTFVINVTDSTHFTYQLPVSPVSVTSITRATSTATVTTSAAHNLTTGNVVLISGATQTEYNGSFTITVTSSTTFTYTVSGTPATPATGTITAAKEPVTPATGTITAKGGRTTVPGVVYLDGYFFVMDRNAVIYNCGLGDPTSWNALDFITANIEPGSGVALAKSQNYVIALKSWSTEFFYDAGNATGSPLSPVLSAFTLIGCASGESVANIDGMIAFVSKTRQKGRAVHVMAGQVQEQISTPDIERILNADTMENVYSYGVRISGHVFYVLGLRDSGLTLVYDFTSKTWGQWTSLTARTAKACTIVSSGGWATATCTAHGLSDGDPVTIAGAGQAEYNGLKQVRVTDANTFLFPVSGAPVSPATGTITATGYDESYFKYTKYVYCSGRDLVLHETTGELCEITDAASVDNTSPINMVCRTNKLDGGSEDRKTMAQLRVIGNKNGGLAMVRWSDDDYTTFSAFRTVDLSSEQARLTRCGSFRRRSFELRHVANAPVQVSGLELEINQEK